MRSSLETWGLWINIGKTKVLGLLHESQKPTKNAIWPYGVCNEEVSGNSILFQSCKVWIHNQCLGVKGMLNLVVERVKVKASLLTIWILPK